MCGVAHRDDLVDDGLEREVGVIECGDVDVADGVEQVGERDVARHPASQRERVDEHPDERIQITFAPPGHRGPDDDVFVGTGPDECDREQRVDDHEHRRAVPTGQVPQPVPGDRVECRGQFGTRVVPDRGPQPIHRQLDELRRTRQTGAPVLELARRERGGVGGVPEPVVLPHRVVGVVDRQWRPAGLPLGQTGLVGGDEVGDHRRDRTTVADDVVHHQDEDHVVLGDAEQPGPDRCGVLEIETPTGDLGDRGGDVGLVGAAHVDGGRHPDVMPVVPDRRDHLLGNAVHRYEPRTEHLVSGKQIRERGGDDHRIRGTSAGVGTRGRRGTQAEDRRDEVAGPAGVQCLEEPDTSLRGRQREHPVAVDPGQRDPARGHSVCKGSGPLGLAAALIVDDRRQTPNGGIGEDRSRGDRRVEPLGCPGRHPGRGERVATEIEQGGGHPDVAHAQDLGDEPGQRRLGGGGGRLGTDRAVPGPRVGQGTSIELAVHGERESRKPDEPRGHHVVGHRGREPRTDLVLRQRYRPGGGRIVGTGGGRVTATAGGDQIADEVIGVPERTDVRPRRVDTVDRRHRRLDLAEFDAETAEFHLAVASSHEFDGPAAGHTDIARAIHAAPRRTERIGDVPRGRLTVPMQESTSDLRARDIQFAGHPVGYRGEPAVEHVHPRTEERSPDVGGGRPVDERAGEFAAGHVDRRLGGTVHVVELRTPDVGTRTGRRPVRRPVRLPLPHLLVLE